MRHITRARGFRAMTPRLADDVIEINGHRGEYCGALSMAIVRRPADSRGRWGATQARCSPQVLPQARPSHSEPGFGQPTGPRPFPSQFEG
jgi:hypothetical protein